MCEYQSIRNFINFNSRAAGDNKGTCKPAIIGAEAFAL